MPDLPTATPVGSLTTSMTPFIARISASFQRSGSAPERSCLPGSQIPGCALILESHARVAAVAERLSGRVTATAQGNYGPSGQAVRISLRVQYLKLPFYADGAVVKWRDFN